MTTRLALSFGLVSLLGGTLPSPSAAQAPERKIAEMELLLLGVSATVEPLNPVIPKNTDAGVRIVVRSGGRELSLSEAAAFFGAGFWVEGELAGFSLAETQTLSSKGTEGALSADPLLLPIPGLRASGDYELNNLRVMAGGRPVLEVQPQHVPVKVIEQVLVTSVKTRPLTLDEIRAKGIVLDSDDYYAFEFSLGLKLESKAVNITFPVAFNRQGVPIPQFILPPPAPTRQADVRLPTIVPVLFEVDQGVEGPPGPGPRLPPMPGGGGEIRIPSVIIIPGNVGYLKQFFSAKLFVANGAPVGSGLNVRDITGKITLPPGKDLIPGTADDPLALPELLRDGKTITQPETMPVRAVGPDGEPGTADDVERLAPGEQGEAEFLVRGEREGFHTIDFDIRATLEGLVTGPVKIKGKAQGPVLVRNPYFDVSFTVPGVIRAGETFKIFVTLTNLSDVAANSVSVTLPEGVASGAKFVGTLPPVFPTIAARASKVFELKFLAQKTGQVVASYLRFDPEDGQTRPVGRLQLAVGIGERGIPLSPDTLVLPAAVDQLPAGVVEAAMRVLGQAWSIANAPTGTLPRDVVRTNRTVVTQKALALAEAGLRVSLGQKTIDALRDVAFDFWGGQPLDPGFDQLLRTTEAGGELRRAIGLALVEAPAFTSPFDLESDLAEVAASGPDFASFAVSGGDPAAPLGITLFDAGGRRTSTLGAGADRPPSEVPGAVLLRLGTETNAPVLGIVAAATGAPYTLDLRSTVDTVVDVSVTLPKGDGTFVRAEFTGVAFQPGTIVHIAHDPIRPSEIVLETEGVSATRAGAPIAPHGPQLLSATVIGPETLQGASPFGFQLVALFDRVVDADSAARKDNYAIPKNAAQGAKRQLSGRLVFVSLEQPEGPHIPTTFRVLGGVSDTRGNEGPSGTVDVGSRLEDPGAVVSGRVFQADGTPVGSGTVTYVNNSDLTCYRPNETGFAALPLDSEGHYEFRYVRQDNCGLPFKIVTVDPATGGRRQASAFVRADGEAITLDLALFGRGAVQGTVRDASGKAVPGASVVAYSQTDPQIGGAATTDGLGHYFIDGITVGPIVVKAGKGVALGSKAGRIDRAGSTTTVNLVLDDKAARVYGKVSKVEDGKQDAVPGVYVLFKHISAENPFGQILGATTTASDGAYAFDGIPVGAFEVSAALNQRDRDAKRGTAIAGESVEQNLLIAIPKAAQLATVSGQVFMPDGATPAHDVVVTIGSRGVVSADGGFTIDGVAVQAGAQTVSAQSRDGRRSGSTTVVANLPKLYDGLTILLSGLGNAAFRVLDEKGQAVKSQQVALLGQCGNPCGCAVATTDQDGIAAFSNLSYGRFYANAIRSSASFTDVANGSVSIVADDTTVLTTMRFAGAGKVEGTVRDALNAPVHGADVLLYSQRFVYDGSSVCGLQYGYAGRTRTGLDGTYSFTGINLGQISVSATQDFFAGAVGNRGALSEPGQVLTLDMAFADTTAGVLSGNVFLPGGASAGAGIEVAVEGPLPEVKVTTDVNGHYEFPHILPEGYYKLTARDPVGGGLARVNVTLKRQEDLARDVQLKGRGTVRVQVVSGTDLQPLESALVKLTETEFPARTFDQSLRPGNQGTVLFLDVYEGPLKVEASDPFARSGSTTAVLPGPGEEIDVQVKVTPTGRVTGRFLMPSRAPVPYGTVTLKAGGRVLGQTTALGSGDVGRFSFDYVPVGPVTLEAQDPATARVGSAAGILDHEGDPPLELDVIAQGLGRVFGTVTRGGNTQALATVAISSGSYRSTTLTDGSGAYDVDGVPEGRVTVTASLNDQGFLAGSNSAALEGDGKSVKIDVALRDAGSVAGQIVPASEADRTAGRFPASLVRLYVGGTGGGRQETSTRPDGSFSFDVVPTGRVSFTADVVDSIDYGSATLDVVAGANTVEIPLNGVGLLKGQAVASEEPGAPGVDGWISFGGAAFPDGATVRLGNDGRFEIPEVLAGTFTARLQHGQGALALYGSASGTVQPGQQTEIRVALQPSGEIRGWVFRPAAIPEGKRPAFGAQVTIVLAKGGELPPLLAQPDGSFSVKGVPLGDFSVRVFDPISNGRAVVRDLHLIGDLTVVPEILIDDRAPVASFVQPVPGSTKSALGGLLVLEVTPETAGDVDPASASVTYPGYGAQGGTAFAWDPATRRFTGSLIDSWLKIGANTLVASVKDLSGNVGQAQVSWTVTGGTVSGHVRGGDGQPKAGATVTLGSLETKSQAPDGAYAFFGLRPGQHCAKATDPDTGLESPTKCGTLVDGEDLLLPDLQLPAAGRLDGSVLRKGGALADGVTVTSSNRSDVTKNGGLFDLGLVPVGTYALAASAPNGDVGAASASVTAGASANATIRLNGVGQVEVTVRNAGGALAPNASVTVSSSAPFPRSHTGKKTGPTGAPVTYDRVLSGTITATASLTGLGGQTTGFLDDGGLLKLTVSLEPAGRISGVVSRREGGPASALVRLTGPKSATVATDPATGAFAFENVPFGHFSLNASTPEGDFGGAQGDLTVADPDKTVPITLNGLGTVIVRVKDVDGFEVPGANVTVSSLGQASSAKADGTGTATVANVRAAASVHATATHPTTGARGDKDGGPLAAAGSLTIDVALERLGTVSGVVYGPDGLTALDGVQVQLSGPPVITHDGGQFSFANLKLGTHTLSAYVNGRLRARDSVALSGPQATKNLTLVGVGIVKGTVTRSGGAVVVGAKVHLQSHTPIYGGFFDTETVAGGAYEIRGVPIGSFTVTATSGADTRQKDGTVTLDGEQVTVDLELLDGAIALPRDFWDGNSLQWTVWPDGSLRRGLTFNSGEGTPRLSVVRGGASASFTGPACSSGVKCAPTEENGREVVLRQADLLGLEATRKVFFPADGYFVRVVDLLYNPATAAPVTVSVLREAKVGGTTVVGTSSGDAAVGSDDEWVAIDDALDDDIYRGTHPNNVVAPTAFVLAGPGRASASSLGASQPAANRTLLAQQWDDVTIAPGQTVAFLSLFSAQADRARAAASAKRLVQLPPEALAGLSAVEAGAVVNFAVPADLVSSVAALPPNDGVVSGRALASDGQTPSDHGGWTSVEFRSRSPHYGRPLTMVPQGGASSGAFLFRGVATPDSPALVPRQDFDLAATAAAGADDHPFAVPPAVATVAFPSQGVIDLTNVVGRVLRVSSVNVSSQTPDKAVDDDLTTSWHAASGDAASQGKTPFFEISLPGDATLHEVRIRGTRNGDGYSIRAGRIELRDRSGAVLWSQDVALPLVGGVRDGDFPVVPAVPGVRSVRLTSTDDASYPGLAELRVLGQADLGPAREAKQDLVFRGTGMLKVRLLRSDGSLVPDSQLRLSDGTRTSGLSWTDAQGTFVWRILPPGTYTVFARHPNQYPVVSVGGVVVSADELKRQDVVFEPFGSVSGTVTTAKNGPIAAAVRLEGAGLENRYASSNATTGLYGFADVPPGTYTLFVTDNRTNFALSRPVTVAAGPPTPANFTLRPVTTIAVTARFGSPSGPPVGFAPAYVEEEPGRGFRFVNYVNNGSVNLTVTGPTVTVRVTAGTQVLSVGEAQAAFDEGDPVTLPIVVPGLGTITGRLLARDGKALGAGPNVLVADPADPTRRISTTVGADGSFQLDSVPVRPLLLRSESWEFFSFFWTVSSAEVPVTLSAHGETLRRDALASVGDIGRPGQVEAWEIRTSAGASITVLLVGRAYADVPALADPLLEVYAPDGTLVASNDNRNGSDKNSQVGFVSAGGRYVILARGAKGSTGGYRLASWAQDEDHVFRPWSGRLLAGHVTRLEDGAPAAGQGVRLLRRGAVPAQDVLLITLAADQQGAFSFPGLWSGSLALEAIDAQGIALARREFEVAPGEDPGALDLVVPVHGTVTVHVKRGSDPVSGALVEVESARTDVLPGDKTRRATTGADGSVSFSVPIGAVTARATDPARPGSSPVEATGAAQETVRADLNIDFAVIRVDVEGFVTNGSLTPLPGATVELVGFGTSPPTGADGFYRFTNVPGGRSWTIRASHPKATAPQSLTLVLGDQNARQDFTLAVPILTGRVLEPDGTRVAGARVQVCGYYYYDPCLTPYVTLDDGRFTFVGRPGWYYLAQIRVTLQDGSNLSTGEYAPFTYYTTGTVDQNVTLPPTATVRGTVTDHAGARVAGAQVSLYQDYLYGSSLIRSGLTDGNGEYRFPHVQVAASQPVRVFAQSPAGDPGENRGNLEPGQQLQLDVSLMESAELRIALRDEIGAPLGGAVTVQALLAPGAGGGIWSRQVSLPPGEPVAVRVPLGPFRIVYDPPPQFDAAVAYDPSDPGAAEGELGSGESLEVTVRRGSHLRQPQTLNGDEGSYSTSESCRDAWCGPFAQTVVPGLRDAYPPYVRPEEQGRALRSLQLAGVGLRVRRQQYVPPSGAFARTLTTLRNLSAAPMTVVATSTLMLDLDYDLSGSFGVGDPFGVVTNGNNLLALVVGSRLPASRAEFRPAVGGEVTEPGALETDHVLTVEPGQTVAFLTFSLAATDGDLGAVTAKASALVDLSHPDALAGLSAQERAAIVNFDVPPLGDVDGTVSFGGTGVVGAEVGLVNAAGGLVSATTTGASGAFALRAVVPGSYSAAAFDPVSGRRGRVAVDVVAGSVSQAPIELLAAAALGSVHVHAVWERVGGAVSGAPLTLRVQGFGPIGEATVVTDPSGDGLLTGIPAGLATVRWPEFYRAQPGTVTVVAGQTVNLELAAPPPGNVSGHVRGAGGSIAVPNVRVEAIDVATGDLLVSGVTDAVGSYSLPDVRAGASGFRIRAIWLADPSVQSERTGSVSQANETIGNFDLDLPIAVVTGHVFFDGGAEAVAYPGVWATQAGGPNPRSYYAEQSGPGGEYTMLVGGVGDYVVLANDNASGLMGQASATVADVAAGADVPVVLQPSGSVTVTAAVSPAQVALSSLGLAFDRFGAVDAAGTFTFDRVALGAFHVQAAESGGIGVRGSATGQLAAAGESATVPITLPRTTTLDGQVLGSRLNSAYVLFRSLENDGPLGPASSAVSAYPNYSFAVPVGKIRVAAVDYSEAPPRAGLAEGVVGPPSDSPERIDVTLGNATLLPAGLTGSDRFRYPIQCDGTLSAGGASAGNEAYSNAYYAYLGGSGFPGGPCLPAAAEEGGRELAIGPRNVAGIVMTRKVYVPPSGGFARHLEILTNPGGAPVTVPVWVDGVLQSGPSTRVLVSSASTGRTYALTDSSACCRPVLGHVFAGPGGRVAASQTQFDAGDGYFFELWTVTIRPGETVALMHFAVQRDRLDTAGARQQAEALANLTDPHALDGMTPLERSQVVNFNVP